MNWPMLLLIFAVTVFFGGLILATVVKWFTSAMQAEQKTALRNRVTPLIATPEAARAKVASLGLPPVFTMVWDDAIPDAFFYWRKPNKYFQRLEELLQQYRRLALCVPLFDDGETLYARDLNTGEFVKCDYYYEVPELTVEADTYQRFAALELIRSTYAGLEDLDEQSRLLEFKYLDRLKEWAAVEDDGRDLKVLEQEFLESIPADE